MTSDRPAPSFLDSYRRDPRRYDELLEGDASVRSHWQPLLQRLQQAGPAAARRSLELTRRLIIENGVTYNVYADPLGRDRPWVLDPLPLVLTAAEWRELEAGVLQRAQLLDALLADLYGPQHLLVEGLIPPEIPYGHPNYLWPCKDAVPAGGRWLHFYAVDLARSPDGQWWVLADRTQTPSGSGYALENRQIVSRALPEMLRDLDVRPLGGFATALRERLLSFASDGEAPLAVVLTPGPYNETYFEHAYLARQLGLPLVDGHDLTVRHDTVYLKSLSGLRRVHAILRRLDDDYCDPVELRGDSALGVPGLIGAVRAGRVVLANALGSGVLESAAWLGFLPGAAQRLLGEKLRLPAVASWWCGERPALQYVLDNLERLVIKPSFPNQRFEPVFGRNLDAAARAKLRERLCMRPHAYVAQEQLAFSQAPVWQTDGEIGFAGRAVGMRVYAISTPQGYRVMPGGLARIAAEGQVDIVSAQRGGGSKDVWVLAQGKATDEQAIAPRAPRVAVRHDDLPSRTVENLYWLGRYAERCEDKARLLRAAFAVRFDAGGGEYALQACRQAGLMDAGRDLAKALFDAEIPLGLSADLRRLGWSATQVRERLSAEHWRTIGDLQRDFLEAVEFRVDPREILDRLLMALAALAGFALDGMTQDDGWRLLTLGRRLERLQFFAALIARQLHGGALPSQGELGWLLDVGDSTITYRTRYLLAPRLGPVIDLLVIDADNPRALAFQWENISLVLARLASSLDISVDDTLDIAVMRLQDTDIGALDGDSDLAIAARRTLAMRLESLVIATGRLSDRLSLRHFSHVDLDLRMVAA